MSKIISESDYELFRDFMLKNSISTLCMLSRDLLEEIERRTNMNSQPMRERFTNEFIATFSDDEDTFFERVMVFLEQETANARKEMRDECLKCVPEWSPVPARRHAQMSVRTAIQSLN